MKNNIKYLTYSILSTIALFFNLSILKNYGDWDKMVSSLYNTNVIAISLVFILLYILYKKTTKIEISKFQNILSFLFAIFMLLGECYINYGTYFIIYEKLWFFIVCLLKVIGFTYLFRVLFNYLNIFVEQKKLKEFKPKNKIIKKYLELFDKYPFRTSVISILVVWSIYVFAFYPIVMSPDPSWQIVQYFNQPNKYIDWVIQRDPNVFMSTHHPITQTYLLGWCIEAGRFILNDNFGLFLYVILQGSIYISVFAYTIKFLKDEKVSLTLRFILLLMYLFVPMYGMYAMTAVKDVLYTSFMILFVLYLYKFIKYHKDTLINFKEILMMILILILMCLFRHNGLYVVILTLPFALMFSKVNRTRVTLIFVSLFTFLYLFNNVLIPYLGISEGSTREVLSLPFQQTARLIKYDSKVYNDSDLAIIDNILGVDDLADRYNPDLADPVKNEYNKYTTKEDLINYFKVWFKGLTKRPDIYIDATLNNTYGYVSPNHKAWYLYSNYNNTISKMDLVDYELNEREVLRNHVIYITKLFPNIPIIGLLCNIGFNTWWIFILLSLILRNKNIKKYYICLIPAITSLLICIVSPANTYFRYTMPYIFVLPVLSMLLYKQAKGDSYEK